MTALPDVRSARWAALTALVTTSVLLTACGSVHRRLRQPAPAARSGGTLTFAVGSDAGCVDPQQVASNETIYSVRQIVDSLTDQDPRTGKIVPWLAKSWDISPDTTTFTFHLRSGVTFSDGSTLTAQVVKDNFDAVPKSRRPGGPCRGLPERRQEHHRGGPAHRQGDLRPAQRPVPAGDFHPGIRWGSSRRRASRGPRSRSAVTG